LISVITYTRTLDIDEHNTMKSWAIYIAAALGFGIYGAVTDADRDSTGTIVGEGNVDAFHVQVGDCFDDASSFADEISNLPGVPCADPHDNETYAVFDLSITNYPEDGGMAVLANESCVERFASFVGKDYESSSLDVMTMYPSPESWKQKDREIVCAVYDMEAKKLVGSAQGRAL
jgi:hypothetical protein